MLTFQFIIPSQVLFGHPARSLLSAKAGGLEKQRLLLVTSPGMPGRTSFQEIRAALEEAHLASDVFSRIPPEPSLEDAHACLEFARQKRLDLVVGLGGGSVMDVAKKVAMDLGAPSIMIPTTSGTGSEVTHESVLKVDGKKKAFVDLRLTAEIAIVDPALSFTMSPRLVASSGIDALAHAVECYDSVKSHLLVKTIALEARRIIMDNLEKAVRGEQEAQVNMSLGSLMAGIAFGNSGTALCHALSYPLSNEGIPHGEAVAMMLPYALRFNGFDEEATQAIQRITRGLGIVPSFKSSPEEMAEVVAGDTRHLSNNPRAVTLKDIVEIFREAQSEGHSGQRK